MHALAAKLFGALLGLHLGGVQASGMGPAGLRTEKQCRADGYSGKVLTVTHVLIHREKSASYL